MNELKENWKPVTIGGTTGILMGAGAMYAVQQLSADDSQTPQVTDEQLQVATTQHGQTFAQAFEAARAEVGPGGVFRWHGNLYNTYTAEEWKAMSDHEKHLFAQQVRPEISPADIDTSHLADEDVASAPESEDVRVAENYHTAADPQPVQSDDDDVRIVGFGDVQLANGRSVTVQELDYNGQRVAVIDIDQDGVADIAMSDVNHNRQMDEGEVIDLHTGEALSFTNDSSEIDNLPEPDLFNA